MNVRDYIFESFIELFEATIDPLTKWVDSVYQHFYSLHESELKHDFHQYKKKEIRRLMLLVLKGDIKKELNLQEDIDGEISKRTGGYKEFGRLSTERKPGEEELFNFLSKYYSMRLEDRTVETTKDLFNRFIRGENLPRIEEDILNGILIATLRRVDTKYEVKFMIIRDWMYNSGVGENSYSYFYTHMPAGRIKLEQFPIDELYQKSQVWHNNQRAELEAKDKEKVSKNKKEGHNQFKNEFNENDVIMKFNDGKFWYNERTNDSERLFKEYGGTSKICCARDPQADTHITLRDSEGHVLAMTSYVSPKGKEKSNLGKIVSDGMFTSAGVDNQKNIDKYEKEFVALADYLNAPIMTNHGEGRWGVGEHIFSKRDVYNKIDSEGVNSTHLYYAHENPNLTAAIIKHLPGKKETLEKNIASQVVSRIRSGTEKNSQALKALKNINHHPGLEGIKKHVVTLFKTYKNLKKW